MRNNAGVEQINELFMQSIVLSKTLLMVWKGEKMCSVYFLNFPMPLAWHDETQLHQSCGIRGLLRRRRWLSCYLEGRNQFVQICNVRTGMVYSILVSDINALKTRIQDEIKKPCQNLNNH